MIYLLYSLFIMFFVSCNSKSYEDGYRDAWAVAYSLHESQLKNYRKIRMLEGPILIDSSYVVISNCYISIPNGANIKEVIRIGENVKEISILNNIFYMPDSVTAVHLYDDSYIQIEGNTVFRYPEITY